MRQWKLLIRISRVVNEELGVEKKKIYLFEVREVNSSGSNSNSVPHP